MRGFGNISEAQHRRRFMAVGVQHTSGYSAALLIGAALLALLAILGSLRISSLLAAPAIHAQAPTGCPDGFVIDYAGLPHGTILGEQYAPMGVHITAVANGGLPNAAIVFDSNLPPTHDPDLAVDVGNIAILAKNLNDTNGDGLVDDPDENDFGGKQVYTFDQPVHIGSFLFIDKDHGTPDKAITYDAASNVIKQVSIPLAGNGSVQTIDVDADNASRLEIVYRDSAGTTGIEVCPVQETPTPTETPAATPTPTPEQPPSTATSTPTPTAKPVTPAATPSASPSAATPTPTRTQALDPTPSPTPIAISAAPVTTSPTPAVLAFPQGGGGSPPALNSPLAGVFMAGWLFVFLSLAILEIAGRLREQE